MAHPAELRRGVAHHEGMRFHGFGDHRTGADQTILAQFIAANDSGVGANGGGKTSLVRSLAGQMPHTGRISIHWQEGRTMGYVPQSMEFDRSLPLTVLDFMALTAPRRPAFLESRAV